MAHRLSIAAAVCLAGAAPAEAGVWFEPGSEALRRDVERLAAGGLLPGPVNAWPLPSAAVCGAAARASGAPGLASAARRIGRTCRDGARPVSLEASAGLATGAAPLRGFQRSNRSSADLALHVRGRAGRFHVALGAGYRAADGGYLHADGGHVAVELGRWAIYGGYVDQWWGPGRDNALLLSTNARPFPKIGFKRLEPARIDLPVLRWLGPVHLEGFAGVLAERRADFDNPVVAAARFAFAPAQGLEIGLGRSLQLCGAGRPCGLRTIADAVLALDSRENTGTPNEPGNQLGGFDVTYRRTIGRTAATFYAEAVGEDEYKHMPEQWGRLAGLRLAGPADARGALWSLEAEWADTLAQKWFGRRGRAPGSLYNHHIYREGYRYRGRSIGSGLDTDGRMLSVSASFTTADDRRVFAGYRSVDLNRTGNAGHALVGAPAELGIANGGIELPIPHGSLRLEGRWTRPLNEGARRLPTGPQVEVGLNLRR